jgi:acetoacetyl-CoA synthetase
LRIGIETSLDTVSSGPSKSPSSTGRNSKLETLETVTKIWRRLLQRPTVGPDDHFFDSGGTPALAYKLVSELGRTFDRELPVTTICNAPTIRLFAALLESNTLRFSPLVLLKPGNQQTPAFIAPGLDGSVMKFCRLARSIASDRPIYGIQARGLDGRAEPHASIEEMARYYVDAIREVQPHGPYYLIGYSLGGLPMLEAARTLSESGEKIGLLALLDAYPHIRHLPLAIRMRVLAQRTKHHASAMKGLPPWEAASYFIGRIRNRLLSSDASGTAVDSLPPELPLARAAQNVRDQAFTALKRYRPRFYKGKITFVKTAGDYYFPSDPVAVWGEFATEIEVETVPGDHLGMINEEFAKLAPVLSRYLL